MGISYFRGFGSYIPEAIKKNEDFHVNTFYDENKEILAGSPELITRKFEKITGIQNRRYASNHELTSDLGAKAAELAIKKSGIDKEAIDHIIVAHNFGNVNHGDVQSVIMPSLASKIKQSLNIHNPRAVAYDLIFGCPGWVQGVIQADSFIKSGMATNVLVIGCETLSRVLDPHDRDSMIFADGAGACILSSKETSSIEEGILSYSSVTHAIEEADYLYCGKSYRPGNEQTKYIKMKGRKIYEYALSNVPLGMKETLDKSGKSIYDVKKIFLHQANEKMDDAIVERFYNLYGITDVPKDIMPMSIKHLGNSSVATIPTLIDLVIEKNLDDHEVKKGDVVIIASVGAGMNINAITYQF